jgi:hypothetical protein
MPGTLNHAKGGLPGENIGCSLGNSHLTNKLFCGGLAMRYHACMSRYAFTRPTLWPSLMHPSGIEITKPPLCRVDWEQGRRKDCYDYRSAQKI